MKPSHRLLIGVTLLLFAVAVLPLILGTGTLYTRDVLTGHHAMKAAQAEVMQDGQLPILDPWRSGGQPSMGNPNSVPLYPTNLLYLVAPSLWAMNAHFWIHWLLAPFAMAWLGRSWSLGRSAAWVAGVCYAASGFFLSLFNLYNLVAGAALAPALIAASLDAAGPHRRPTAWLEVGGLWGLMILSGDPLFAALALGLAILAVVYRGISEPSEEPWHAAAPRFAKAFGLPLGLGTVLAAPMLVEFWRILPLSFRGYWQFSPESALSQSWNPLSALEWWIPSVFGAPDFTFWGFRFYGGNPPLLYSLYPGVLCLGLMVAAGWSKGSETTARAHRWGWAVVLLGLFVALGAWNPVIHALLALPGASLLRYPVKVFLVVAIGASLICGLGFERLGEPAGRRRLGWTLGALAAFFFTAWISLARLPMGLGDFLRGLDPRLAGPLFAGELRRLQHQTLLSLILVGVLAAALYLGGRRPRLGGVLLIVVHVLGQTTLLGPLIHADDMEPYTSDSPVLEWVSEDSRIVHGSFNEIFGRRPGSPLEIFPDPRFFWLSRVHFHELQPFAGIPRGLRYELFHTPEGLDSFFLVSLTRAMPRLDDAGRLQILRALGVDTLLLPRPLDPSTDAGVRLQATVPSAAAALHIYKVLGHAEDFELVGTVRRTPHMDAALSALTDPTFDPRTMVVLPESADGPQDDQPRPKGTVEVLEDTLETSTLTVDSPQGGVLLTQRSYHDIYRVTVDGEPVEPLVGNIQRLAVEVPPGRHEVHIEIDRGPFRLAWVGAFLALLGLVGTVWRSMRVEHDTGTGAVP